MKQPINIQFLPTLVFSLLIVCLLSGSSLVGCAGTGDTPADQEIDNGQDVNNLSIPGDSEESKELDVNPDIRATDSQEVSDNMANPRYDFADKKPTGITLPKSLTEISGLTVSHDNRLFAHNDEVGTIHEIDFENGTILKSWSLGPKKVKADFEGIAINGDTFYMTTNSGNIYEFKEGEDKSEVTHTSFKSGLTADQNVEGLCYDASTNSLLLACKADPGQGLEDSRAIYSVALPLGSAPAELSIVLPLQELTQNTNNSEFMPSGIALHPQTGHFYVVATRGKTLVEFSADGTIHSQVSLSKKVHKQPEGICISANGTIYIANEGAGGKGRVFKFAPLN